MRKIWDGTLPVRRYAIFNDVLRGNYAIVVRGKDIETAERWGGFVSWLGGVREAITRKVLVHNATVHLPLAHHRNSLDERREFASG